MSCKRFGPAIAAHAAGAALDPAAERHLGGCAACRQRLDTQARLLAELDAELGRSLSISASPDFVARVARAARDIDPAPVRRWIPAPVWAGLAVAAAIVLALWVREPSVDNPFPPTDVHLSAESVGPGSAVGQGSVVSPGSTVGPGSAVGSGSSDPGRSAPARARTLPPVATARRAVNADPPVIVEPERALALQRLRELMIQGRLNEKMLPPPVAPEAALADLTIAPLEIAEIRIPDVEIVGRPPAAPQRQ